MKRFNVLGLSLIATIVIIACAQTGSYAPAGGEFESKNSDADSGDIEEISVTHRTARKHEIAFVTCSCP
ncbi:MAG: hypothetical protein ACE5F8_01450 [Woeseiaceae bacterium]